MMSKQSADDYMIWPETMKFMNRVLQVSVLFYWT